LERCWGYYFGGGIRDRRLEWEATWRWQRARSEKEVAYALEKLLVAGWTALGEH
jgi:hypothetical protein